MSTFTTLSTSGASSIGGDEAMYANSTRVKKLMKAVDSLVIQGETQYDQLFTRYLLKRIGRRTDKIAVAQLRDYCDKMVSEWHQDIQKEADDILDEHEIKYKLYTLDEMIWREKSRGNDQMRWRPCGYPKSDMKAYYQLRKFEHHQQFAEFVENLEKVVEAQQREVEHGRVQVQKADKELSELAKELKGDSGKRQGKRDENRKSKSNNADLEELKRQLDILIKDT